MKDNNLLSRFELQIDGQIVYANYRITENILNIDYVFAPQELRGTGAAGKLMKEISDLAQKRQMKIHPICGYAAAWLHRHKEYHDLVI